MPALTKTQTTAGLVSFCLTVPEHVAGKFEMALAALLALTEEEDDGRMYGIAETFPDMGPGNILRAMRRRGDLTQEHLAEAVGTTKANISAMETGKRPIGKAMAERLAKALNTSYKVFL